MFTLVFMGEFFLFLVFLTFDSLAVERQTGNMMKERVRVGHATKVPSQSRTGEFAVMWHAHTPLSYQCALLNFTFDV